MSYLMKALMLFGVFSLVILAGCVRQPTSKERVVDDRPAVSFVLPEKASANGYEVYVDNLAVGSVSRYLAGKSALRVLSGSHLVRVEKNGEVVVNQTLYLGDGAVREITLP